MYPEPAAPKIPYLLTVLGVLIGCCAIVIMVSIGIGMKESQDKLLSEMGDLTIITVYPKAAASRGKSWTMARYVPLPL